MDADHPWTAPPGTPSAVDRVEQALVDARGEPADARWATAAAGRLLLDGVDEPHLLRALDDVAEQVRRSGESPDDLFGDPLVWARQQQDHWLDDGVDAVPPEPLEAPRDVVVGGLVTAALLAALLAVVHALSGEGGASTGWSGLALPVALGLAVTGAHAAYRRLIQARSQVAAVVAVGAGVVVLSAGLAYVLVEVAPQPTRGVSAWWLLAVAGSCTIAAVAVGSLPRRPGVRQVTNRAPAGGLTTGDDRWCRELAAALRDRGGFPDRRVARLVAEARAHGVDSGRPLLEEFGPARLHARRYAPDPRVADRRYALVWAVIAVVPLLRLADHVRENGWHLQLEPVLLALWAAAALLLAAHHGRRWRAAHRRTTTPATP